MDNIDFKKDDRTFFRFEQIEGEEPKVDAHGDPEVLIGAAFALVAVVMEQFPETRQYVKWAFKYVMGGFRRNLTPDAKKRAFWSGAINMVVGVLACFGILMLIALLLNKTYKLFL